MAEGRTIDQFSADLEKFSQVMDIDLETMLKAVAFKLFDKFIRRTPVDTGRARGSWTMQEHRPDPSVLPENTNISNGQATQTALASTVTKLSSPYTILYLSNNLPYIVVLEFGEYGEGPKTSGGFSLQAPLGMVRVSLAEVEAEISAEIGARI